MFIGVKLLLISFQKYLSLQVPLPNERQHDHIIIHHKCINSIHVLEKFTHLFFPKISIQAYKD